MAVIRVQHTYNHKSGLPVDAVVNTFHFQGGTGVPATAAIAETLSDLVLAFYDSPAPGAGTAVRSFIAEASMAPLRHTVKAYDLTDAEPRIPLWSETTAGNVEGNNAQPPGPAEVAVCLSYRGPLTGGAMPMSRRRGRLYIGPLNSGMNTTTTNGHSRPDVANRTSLVLAGRELAVDAAAAGWPFVVWSRGGVEEPGGEFGGGWLAFATQVVHFWCDDAYDTMRSRGPKPTSRVTADLPG